MCHHPTSRVSTVPNHDATEAFFDELGRRGHEPLLGKVTGTIRFDLRHGEETDGWFVAVDKGHLKVSREGAKADCVLTTDKSVFDEVARGEVNPMAALLRGALAFEGNPELLVMFRRLFPPPPKRKPRTPRRGR
jgi:putative sterol carrier protein